MTWTMFANTIQLSPDVAPFLERMAWAQTGTAVGRIIVALFAIGLVLVAIGTLRSANRTLKHLERAVEQLAPRTEPILERATRIADDAGEVSRSVREAVEELVGTVQDLNGRLRAMSDSAEERVRHLGAVLAVVQREAEELLIDAAATARGIHVTASALRNSGELGPDPDDDPRGSRLGATG